MNRRQLLLAAPGLLLAGRLGAHSVEELHVYPGTLHPLPGQPGEAIAGFEIHAGTEPDVLTAAASPAARAIRIIGRDGKPATRLPVPAGTELTLGPNGPHLRLSGISGPLTPGRELLLQLRFARAGVRTGSLTVPRTRGGA